MWHSERLVGTGLLFSATKPKWSLLLPSSFNTLSTGIHADSQHNLFWKRHGGLMRNFCPKYGSFVVVKATASSVHDIFPKQLWFTEQNVKTKVIRLLHYCHSGTNLRRASPRSRTCWTRDVFRWPPRVWMQGNVYRLGCPYLVSFLQTRSNPDTVSPRRQDCTAQNVHLCKKLNLVLIVSISFF